MSWAATEQPAARRARQVGGWATESARRGAHGPVVGGAGVAAAAGGAVLHPRHPAAFHQEPEPGGGCRRSIMAGLAWGLPCRLGFPGPAQLLHRSVAAIPPLVVMGLAILFNALADYALIFGHFGLPRLGLLGAGLASAVSNMFSFAAMLAVCLAVPALKRYRILHRLWQPHWRSFVELFRLGLPIGVTMVFEVALFNGADPGDGHLRHWRRWRRTRSPSPFPRSPSWCRWASAWRRRCGWGLRPARATCHGGAARRLHRHRPWARASCAVTAAGAAAVAPAASPRCGCRTVRPTRDVLALAVSFLHVAAAFQLVDGIAGDRLHEPARPQGCARADVAGGRVLLAGRRAHVRWCWPSGSA